MTPILQTKVPTTRQRSIMYLIGIMTDSSPRPRRAGSQSKDIFIPQEFFSALASWKPRVNTRAICPAPSRTVLVILAVLE